MKQATRWWSIYAAIAERFECTSNYVHMIRKGAPLSTPRALQIHTALKEIERAEHAFNKALTQALR